MQTQVRPGARDTSPTEYTLLHLARYKTTKDHRPPQGLDASWTPGLICGATQAHGSVHNTGSSREPTPATEAAGPAVDRTQNGTHGGSGRMTTMKRSCRARWAEPEAAPAAVATPQLPWRPEAPCDGPRRTHSRAGLTLTRPEQLQLRVHSLQATRHLL